MNTAQSKWFWPLLLTAAAAAARVPGLERGPLWLDEANTVLISWQGAGGVIEA